MFALIFAQFDAIPPTATYMPIDMWRSTFNNLVKIIQLLRSNPHIELKEMHQNSITLLSLDEDNEQLMTNKENIESDGSGSRLTEPSSATEVALTESE
jgi:hypothetical protein